MHCKRSFPHIPTCKRSRADLSLTELIPEPCHCCHCLKSGCEASNLQTSSIEVYPNPFLHATACGSAFAGRLCTPASTPSKIAACSGCQDEPSSFKVGPRVYASVAAPDDSVPQCPFDFFFHLLQSSSPASSSHALEMSPLESVRWK